MSKKSTNEVDDDRDVVKVCKWDGTAVKNALDDAVGEVMTEKLPYDEDHSLMDIRLVICGFSVLVALFALAWDYLYPFPASRQVLIGCVGTYFFMMGVLTLYTTYMEKGIFVVVREKDPTGFDPDCKWQAASSMKKFDDMYNLVLTFQDGKTGLSRQESFNKSVADFFDEDGAICMDLVESAVMKLHKSLSSLKKDL